MDFKLDRKPQAVSMKFETGPGISTGGVLLWLIAIGLAGYAFSRESLPLLPVAGAAASFVMGALFFWWGYRQAPPETGVRVDFQRRVVEVVAHDEVLHQLGIDSISNARVQPAGYWEPDRRTTIPISVGDGDVNDLPPMDEPPTWSMPALVISLRDEREVEIRNPELTEADLWEIAKFLRRELDIQLPA